MPLKTEYIISVLKQGDGAAQAVGDFQKVGVAAAATNVAIGTTAKESTSNMKSASMAIKQSLSLIGLYAFPEATLAAHALGAGLKAIKASALALNITFTTVGVAVAGVAAAIAMAIQVMRLFGAVVVETQTDADLLFSNQKMFDNLKRFIDQFEAAGRLTAEKANELRTELRASESLRDDPAAESRALRVVSQQLVGVSSQIAAEEKLKSLRREMQEDLLKGLDLERAKNQDTYDERIKQITEEEKRSKTRLETERALAQQALDVQNRRANIQEGRKANELFGQLSGATLDEFSARRLAAQRKYIDQMAEIERFEAEGIISEERKNQLLELNVAARKKEEIVIAELEKKASVLGQIEEHAAQQFATGFSNAFLDFVSGTKSAEDAFKEFAASFLRAIAEMIMQTLILRALKSAFGLGAAEGGVFLAAQGGVFPRMMAVGGVATVAQPTYFPRFNVVAGEAGPEMLTVLSRPRLMQLGGVEAAVGNAGSQRLAITDAAALSDRATKGGMAEIAIRLSPGLEASITQNSIEGARIRIVRDMHEDSDLSQATRKLVS